MKLTKRQITSFQQKIFSWWKTHRRDLPWRHTRDPYRIMVSEVMLQQTQVLRVVAKYREFIERYPTIKILAHASPGAVLRIWKGMGYNRRALYLQRAAKMIVEEYHGIFPLTEKDLRNLPGLGIYTARALLVFAYEQEVPLIDTNIRQIVTHFFLKDQTQGRALEKEIEDIARQLIPPGKSWQWHQALMDYGALAMTNVPASPAGRQYPMTNRKKQKPFKDSNRYYRGRIVDRLREGEISEKKFLNELGKTYTKPVAFLLSIIASLVKDGLIERSSRGVLRLPV
ncbi:MAG: Fe-S cluster assembly protein HesB [Candidatus Gottesmanbacteria bacterium]|nr:Fe-S cluster assembly protein HesB [Candidatus Gottesmanbacteria bacterium]